MIRTLQSSQISIDTDKQLRMIDTEAQESTRIGFKQESTSMIVHVPPWVKFNCRITIGSQAMICFEVIFVVEKAMQGLRGGESIWIACAYP